MVVLYFFFGVCLVEQLNGSKGAARGIDFGFEPLNNYNLINHYCNLQINKNLMTEKFYCTIFFQDTTNSKYSNMCFCFLYFSVISK